MLIPRVAGNSLVAQRTSLTVSQASQRLFRDSHTFLILNIYALHSLCLSYCRRHPASRLRPSPKAGSKVFFNVNALLSQASQASQTQSMNSSSLYLLYYYLLDPLPLYNVLPIHPPTILPLPPSPQHFIPQAPPPNQGFNFFSPLQFSSGICPPELHRLS